MNIDKVNFSILGALGVLIVFTLLFQPAVPPSQQVLVKGRDSSANMRPAEMIDETPLPQTDPNAASTASEGLQQEGNQKPVAIKEHYTAAPSSEIRTADIKMEVQPNQNAAHSTGHKVVQKPAPVPPPDSAGVNVLLQDITNRQEEVKLLTEKLRSAEEAVRKVRSDREKGLATDSMVAEKNEELRQAKIHLENAQNMLQTKYRNLYPEQTR